MNIVFTLNTISLVKKKTANPVCKTYILNDFFIKWLLTLKFLPLIYFYNIKVLEKYFCSLCFYLKDVASIEALTMNTFASTLKSKIMYYLYIVILGPLHVKVNKKK